MRVLGIDPGTAITGWGVVEGDGNDLQPVAYGVVTTPAGTFATTHYRLATVNDVWITGPDRIMVRMVNTARDLEYLIVELASGGDR